MKKALHNLKHRFEAYPLRGSRGADPGLWQAWEAFARKDRRCPYCGHSAARHFARASRPLGWVQGPGGELSRKDLGHRREVNMVSCSACAKDLGIAAEAMCYFANRAVGEIILADGTVVLPEGKIEQWAPPAAARG